MPTASLCPDTTALVLKVAQIPTISITTNKTEGCVPLDVTLTTPNNNGGSGLWYLGDGSEPQTDLSIIKQTGVLIQNVINVGVKKKRVVSVKKNSVVNTAVNSWSTMKRLSVL